MYHDTISQIRYASILAAMLHRELGVRQLERKEIAAKVRGLLKSLGIKGMSVTAPSYSMAQTIHISFPRCGRNEHEPVHFRLEAEERAKGGPYRGMALVCPFCRVEREARDRLETLILAAFPDLDDRSDLQSDYFDYILSFN